jgi:hypothetical protein
MSFSVRAALAAALCFVVAACGGGGGGGDGGGSGGGGGSGSGGRFSVSSNNLTFTANGPAAATPASQWVLGTVADVTASGTLYIVIVGSGNAIDTISPVTLVDERTGRASVSVRPPSSLGVGTHTGVITVRACMNDPGCASSNLQGSPQTINVTYHVAALQSSAASLDYSIGNTVSASEVSRQATITGIPAQNWAATANANWLTITAGGSSGSSLNASLVQGVVDNLNNGTYTGSITLTPGTAGQPLVIPVSLSIRRTQVSYVAPYVAYTGASGNVIIRGEEFSQIAIQNVLFGDTPASSFTIVSGTEIRAALPPSLPRGRHTVRLQADSAGVKQLAELVVVDAPVFSAAELLFPAAANRDINALVYDAERAALGVSSSHPDELVHFRSVSNAWQPATSVPLVNHSGLALSADGKEWIAGNYRDVVHIGAGDLVKSEPITSPLFPSGQQVVAEMAVSNDGTVAMFGDVYYGCGATLMLYDPRKRLFSTPGYTACRGNIGASGDGSRLLIANQFTDFSTDDVLSLNTATGARTPTGIHLLTGAPVVMDRTGARIVLNKRAVYDGAYTLLGNLPATTDAVVLSPDGTRAHAFDRSGQLRTYDLVAAPVAGVFQQIGPGITLAGDPGPYLSPLPLPYTDVAVMMTITPDGRTVFIAGRRAVIVQPVP